MDANSRKMSESTLKRLWLAYLVAILGSLLTIVIWFFAWKDLEIEHHFHYFITYVVPWLTLPIGFSISILLGRLIYMTQTAKRRAERLNLINVNLKKEIEERRLLEESKQKLEAALQQGQKLQAMGTLAGGIAHDFNNILYAIGGYVAMAREDVPKDSLVYENLGKVLEASHRGQDLIARILSFSRRQHHQFSELNVASTIEAVLSLLKPTIPASVALQVSFEEDTSIIFGNQTDLHQVLVNLINNAVDAMDGEGNITIHISRLLKNDPILKKYPSLTPEQNYCKIEVADTGNGMDIHTMERIFEPFYTTKEVGKGTGLGLSIVHSIVKDHQGEITVASELGKGTTFTILLPELSAK